MTMAKIGLSMKNLAIGSPFDRDARAGSYFLQTVHDDGVTRPQSLLDDDALIYAVAREDGSCPDDVVGIDGQDRLLSLHVLYGALWYQHGLRTRADTDADAHELAR